ncbi:MAG: hypothetical protein GY803_22785 [Chloroflexi bacterium]|nr:hypothetical protein [Chloroflexota bacterium]
MTNLEVITSENVIEALRLWHGGEGSQWSLTRLRLGRQIRQQADSFGSLAETGPAARNRAILSLGLNELRKTSPEAEELLRARYEHKRDVIRVANSLNITESSVYYRQRQAVNQLADILIELETQASSVWRERMAARLDMQSYDKLIGVKEPRTALAQALIDENERFIVALDGLGGIGKTSLADQVTRDLIKTTRFDEIAWITAKQTHLSTLGRLQIESGRPILTFPMIMDELVVQFDLPGNENDSQLQRHRTVQRTLRERACLVVLDNLETVADHHNILPELRKWERPSKFLLTSRVRLLDVPGVFSLSLRELTAESTFALIRSEAKRTGFTALAKADDDDLQPIYDAVGGNPLALKLIAGQLRFHSLAYVLERFTQSAPVDKEAGIFDYIYREIWESLQPKSKMTLLALTQAGKTGFNLEHLAKVADLLPDTVSRSLEKLILLSLVDLTGNLLDRRYRLHRLTEVFLLKMFAEA